MTSSLLARPTESRTPRLASTPPFFDGSLGGDAVDLADYAGLHLDPWQADVLKDSLNRRVGGKWAALEVGLVVPRQNGKGAIIEARQLASLFLTRDAQSIYSAHQFKALDVATPILTGSGWSTMGELRDGDEVFAPDGQLTKVVTAHPVRHGRPCYEVAFADGQTVVADAEHLWQVTDTLSGAVRVVTTAVLAAEGTAAVAPRTGRDRRTYRFRVDLPAPLTGVETPLPIDPWLLGAWLGDGDTNGGRLTVGAEDLGYVLTRLDALGETYRVSEDRRRPGCVFYVGIYGLRSRLIADGLLGHKHIPAAYQLASERQRRELLAGVMDTDGTVSGSQIVVTMVKRALMDDVASLVRSLGYKASLREFRAALNGRDAGPMYRVQFTACQQVTPFGMPRKSARVQQRQIGVTRAHYNAIVAVSPVPTRPTRCITVAHESSLYVVGRGFIPTHNTSKTMFRRIKQLVRQTPELHKLTGGKHDSSGTPVGGMYRQSNEETGIELTTGERLNFFARSGGSGRGFTGDTMIFDEAYDLDPDMIADLLPTLSAVSNPQVWYVSSAGMDSSEQLAAIRERGIAGNEPRLMYREWSGPDDADSDDEAVLLASNPGVECGRLGLDFIQLVERPGMTEDRFRRERLGIWRPPATVEVAISANDWNAQKDLDSRLHSRMVFAVDMTGDRSTTAISVAGLREDGAYHVEVVEYRPNTDSSWVVPWLVERKAAWNPLGIVIRPGSPAGSLLPDLAAVGIEAMQPGTTAVVQGCGAFYDAVMGHKLWHIDQQPLTVAVGRATTKSMAGAWAWDYTSGVDITPLVSVTLALWGYSVKASEVKDVAASVW